MTSGCSPLQQLPWHNKLKAAADLVHEVCDDIYIAIYSDDTQADDAFAYGARLALLALAERLIREQLQ